MTDGHGLAALVVYESFFGNTESIARAIASGLRLEDVAAEAVDVGELHDEDLDAYDLLVVGGPTHAFALSRPQTRRDAAARGGDTSYATRGLREWLSAMPARSGTHLAAAFDTRVSKVRHLPPRGPAHRVPRAGCRRTTRAAPDGARDLLGPFARARGTGPAGGRRHLSMTFGTDRPGAAGPGSRHGRHTGPPRNRRRVRRLTGR